MAPMTIADGVQRRHKDGVQRRHKTVRFPTRDGKRPTGGVFRLLAFAATTSTIIANTRRREAPA